MRKLTFHQYFDLYHNAYKKAKNQENLRDFLRDFRFIFVSQEALVEREFPVKFLNSHSDFQFMVRTEKDHFTLDPHLIFGFKLFGDQVDKIPIYINKEHFETWEVPHKDTKINFKKLKIKWRFPKDMTYEQRKDWRTEYEKIYQKGTQEEPSDFFKKWEPYVKFLD